MDRKIVAIVVVVIIILIIFIFLSRRRDNFATSGTCTTDANCEINESCQGGSCVANNSCYKWKPLPPMGPLPTDCIAYVAGSQCSYNGTASPCLFPAIGINPTTNGSHILAGFVRPTDTPFVFYAANPSDPIDPNTVYPWPNIEMFYLTAGDSSCASVKPTAPGDVSNAISVWGTNICYDFGSKLTSGAFVAHSGSGCYIPSNNTGIYNSNFRMIEDALPNGGCKSSADCATGNACIAGMCKNITGNSCTTNSDCQDAGFSCINGACASNRQCVYPYDCGTGKTCTNGSCVSVTTTACTNNTQCPWGMSCVSGTCTPTPVGCTVNANCGLDQYCNNGVCTASQTTNGCYKWIQLPENITTLPTDSVHYIPGASACKGNACMFPAVAHGTSSVWLKGFVDPSDVAKGIMPTPFYAVDPNNVAAGIQVWPNVKIFYMTRTGTNCPILPTLGPAAGGNDGQPYINLNNGDPVCYDSSQTSGAYWSTYINDTTTGGFTCASSNLGTMVAIKSINNPII